jgi:hypothetical protein
MKNNERQLVFITHFLERGRVGYLPSGRENTQRIRQHGRSGGPSRKCRAKRRKSSNSSFGQYICIQDYKIRKDLKCCFSFEWFEMVARGTFSAGFTQPHLHAACQDPVSVRRMLGFHSHGSSRVSDVYR